MSRGAVRVEGADRLASTMRGAGRQLRTLPGAGESAGRILAGEITARAPRRQGTLRASVAAAVDGPSVSVTAGARHAGPINFGVGPRPGLRGPHNITATFFATGAWPAVADRLRSTYTRAVRDALTTIQGA